MASHVRKDDEVIITAGQFKGQTGKVLSVDPTNSRVIVKGPGIKGMVKTLKPNRLNTRGGQVELDRSFHISNVSPVDGKPSRVRFETKPDGSKVRIAARNGAVLGTVRSADKGKGKTKKAAAPAAKPAATKKKTTTKKKAAASA